MARPFLPFNGLMLRRVALAFGLLALPGPLVVLLSGAAPPGGDWRTAPRDSAHIAPDPAATSEAIVQVYSARAFGLRGIFGVHTWIAVKEREASAYTVLQVIGWRLYRGEDTLVVAEDLPDRLWFGRVPQIIAEKRGSEAEEIIPAIFKAAADYPYARTYHMWPGPNSNSFTAFIARRVPGLRLDLPPTAIGKDFLEPGRFCAASPTGTGYQCSLYGVLGVLAGRREGLEFNLLGLSFGVDPFAPALRWPGIGKIGWAGEGAHGAP